MATDDEVRAAAKRWRSYRKRVPASADPDENDDGWPPKSYGGERDCRVLADALLAWEDRAGVIDADGPAFAVGDAVRKVGGDYSFEGVVRGVIRKASGAVRFAVEDARGVLMIYSAANLERLA